MKKVFLLMPLAVAIGCSAHQHDPAPIVRPYHCVSKPYVAPPPPPPKVIEEEEDLPIRFTPKEEKKAKLQANIQELERKKRAKKLQKTEVEQLKQERATKKIDYEEEEPPYEIED